MRFKEVNSNRVNEQYALYMSSEEALRLRSELGELRKNATGASMREVYRSMHELLMKNGISNELPVFESDLLEERAARKGGERSGAGKRAYNSAPRKRKAG